MTRITESYRKAFDALGVDKVRRFANNPSSTGEKLEQALLWLGEKEAEQQHAFMTRIEARMAEHGDLARRTKSAAQIAAVLAAIAALQYPRSVQVRSGGFVATRLWLALSSRIKPETDFTSRAIGVSLKAGRT